MCGLFLTVKFSCLFTAVAVLICLKSLLLPNTHIISGLGFYKSNYHHHSPRTTTSLLPMGHKYSRKYLWFRNKMFQNDESNLCKFVPPLAIKHSETARELLYLIFQAYFKVRLHRRFLLRSFSFWCMRLNGLTYKYIRPSVQSYINQYFCDLTT